MAGNATVAREVFKPVYDSLYLAYQGGEIAYKPVAPNGIIYPDRKKYPQAAIFPNGDVVGTHYYVLKYVRDCQLTGRRKRTDPTTIEVHHLLEDRCMKHFGIRRSEGICVALEQEDHQIFSSELPSYLPRRDFMADVDVVYQAHCDMYRDNGHREWINIQRKWLRDQRHRIMSHYSAGKVAGATLTDVKRVRNFFSRL
jgi:hypothetical protein